MLVWLPGWLADWSAHLQIYTHHAHARSKLTRSPMSLCRRRCRRCRCRRRRYLITCPKTFAQQQQQHRVKSVTEMCRLHTHVFHIMHAPASWARSVLRSLRMSGVEVVCVFGMFGYSNSKVHTQICLCASRVIYAFQIFALNEGKSLTGSVSLSLSLTLQQRQHSKPFRVTFRKMCPRQQPSKPCSKRGTRRRVHMGLAYVHIKCVREHRFCVCVCVCE